MSEPVLHLPDGTSLPIDEKGYLRDHTTWTPLVAETMAAADSIELKADHWQLIQIFQDYFKQYEIEPPMRALVKIVRECLGEEKGNSRYLYRLFPDGPTTQVTRYAGLPRPVSCI
jgi:tRNA 2-thiouridine synthesizing protein E